MNAAPTVGNIIRRSATLLGVRPEFGDEGKSLLVSYLTGDRLRRPVALPQESHSRIEASGNCDMRASPDGRLPIEDRRAGGRCAGFSVQLGTWLMKLSQLAEDLATGRRRPIRTSPACASTRARPVPASSSRHWPAAGPTAPASSPMPRRGAPPRSSPARAPRSTPTLPVLRAADPRRALALMAARFFGAAAGPCRRRHRHGRQDLGRLLHPPDLGTAAAWPPRSIGTTGVVVAEPRRIRLADHARSGRAACGCWPNWPPRA